MDGEPYPADVLADSAFYGRFLEKTGAGGHRGYERRDSEAQRQATGKGDPTIHAASMDDVG
jgi:hypothetical protein